MPCCTPASRFPLHAVRRVMAGYGLACLAASAVVMVPVLPFLLIFGPLGLLGLVFALGIVAVGAFLPAMALIVVAEQSQIQTAEPYLWSGAAIGALVGAVAASSDPSAMLVAGVIGAVAGVVAGKVYHTVAGERAGE